MISINAMNGSSKPIEKVYPEAKISDIVKLILKEAKLPFKKENIEETENKMLSDGFTKPYTASMMAKIKEQRK